MSSLIQATVGTIGGRAAVAEPGWLGSVGGVQSSSTLRADLRSGPVVERSRGVSAHAGMAVDVVVVIERDRAEGPGVLVAAEATWECRAVLEGLEVRLPEGVVVAHVGRAWVRTTASRGGPGSRRSIRREVPRFLRRGGGELSTRRFAPAPAFL